MASGRRVECPRCRYLFSVEVAEGADWQVEEQCPSCESRTLFTIENTPERQPPRPKPEDLDLSQSSWVRELFAPINQHRSHAAVTWFDRVGNGGFEDEYAPAWPIPWRVYRFRRGEQAAYAWQVEGVWFVRGWHQLRTGMKGPPERMAVASLEAALDRLVLWGSAG